MKKVALIISIGLLVFGSLYGQKSYETAKPWTYWWWMGSAVNKTDIKKQLVDFSKAGLGGVHIIPIYGVKGYESEFKNFLSEEWLEHVDYTIKEAEKLNMGVDMTLGTGWPFGGSWINKEQAAKQLLIKTFSLKNLSDVYERASELEIKYGITEIVALYADNGQERIALSPYLKNRDLKLNAKRADWNLTLFGMAPTAQMVKRAAPGGEGLVMDYFDKQAVNHYLKHFDSIFSNTKFPINPRAFYHDSYEVYRANWTDYFLDAFIRLQGYDLMDYIYILNEKQNKNYPLIVHDVRETIAELLHSQFTETWTNWSKEHNAITRNQAHGSPGNLLDLYALVDIPETESFGCSQFDIPGLQCDNDYNAEKFGRPNPLMMKFASSPAHLLNKPLVSSETGTWLGDHFKVSLKRVKPQIDELLIAGINHVIYHGTTYSPQEAGFPGWLFYASTNFGQSSHFREEFPLLNNYITNCQKVIQQAKHDNDMLLYFPINDIWTKYRAKKRDILFLFDVHHYEEWFSEASFGQTAEMLWNEGFTFDYVSDKQMAQLKVDPENNVYISNLSKYKTIIVPKVDYIPEATLEALKQLSDKGARVIFQEDLPKFYSGFPSVEVDYNRFTSENFRVSEGLSEDIRELDIFKETIKTQGLDFIRKKNKEGYLYFITNLSNQFNAGEVSLATKYNYITITNPLKGNTGYVKTNDAFYLNISPGKSLLVQTSMTKPNVEEWKEYKLDNKIPIEGNWKVSFGDYQSQGLKDRYQISQLNSWTTWEDKGLKTYSGKAHYTSSFSLDTKQLSAKKYMLYIDEVRETANVIINGVDCGTIWSFPNQLEIPSNVIQEHNKIEIIVQNLSSNYMKKYDSENPGWKKFYDINFVNITYDKFSTDKWGYEPSGLIGEIYLVTKK